MNYAEIELIKIASNPNNPRSSFSGPKFDDLINSIREKGVLEPVLVRQIEGPDAEYEIVAGERRFRALYQLAGADLKKVKIPAIVRDISEDEAFEIMTIENLQREDLTPLEEAESFSWYIKRRGKDSLEMLAEKTGIRPAYIRRRIAILRLPKRALDAWEKGDLSFGHLEELIRLKDKQDLKEVLDRLLRQGWREMTVRDLREQINARIPLLNKAQFDKTECNSCMQNSDVQKKLWDIEPMKKTHCLNPKCFRKKQTKYLTENWPQTNWAKRYKTTGFVFKEDLQWDDANGFYAGGPFKKCLDGCDDFKTILHLDGSCDEGQACVKNKDCHQRQNRSQGQKEASAKRKKEDDGGPRVNWHGQHFREQFFQMRIPEQFKAYQPDDVKMLRTALYSLIKLEWDLYRRFTVLAGLTKEEDGGGYVDEAELFKAIAGMKRLKLREIIKELSLQVVLSNDVEAEGRRLLADHIGIDLSKEWAPTDEFYQLKTIRELLEYGEKTGILEDEKAQVFLKETLRKKKFSACKKGDLIRVFKESGIDLVGKVPDEILG